MSFYESDVRVDVKPGAIKLVHLPSEREPVAMGIHGPIAAHYHVSEGAFEGHASTLDYIVGAATACLTGTLNRALAMKRIPTAGGRLQVAGQGHIEIEGGVLIIRSIEVTARLKAKPTQRSEVEQIIAEYSLQCPVYRSLFKSIEIVTKLEFESDNTD